jgi:hypothetical protein
MAARATGAALRSNALQVIEPVEQDPGSVALLKHGEQKRHASKVLPLLIGHVPFECGSRLDDLQALPDRVAGSGS